MSNGHLNDIDNQFWVKLESHVARVPDVDNFEVLVGLMQVLSREAAEATPTCRNFTASNLCTRDLLHCVQSIRHICDN